MYKVLCLAFSILLAAISICPADTFVHRQSGETLHGYATQQTIDNKSLVHTTEKGQQYLNLAAYDVQADRLGRENRVIVISLEESILLEIETQAIEKAVVSASDQGPLFILLEIDTPGGRVDLVKQICAAIMKTDNCRVIAFVPGGKYGGAFSGGAAIALACDKIYMAGGTAIGAVALTAQTSTGQKDIDEIYGETVSEKFTSAWRGYLAALAEKAEPFARRIDVDDGGFLAPGDMPTRINEHLAGTGQEPIDDKGQMIRTVLENLALKYRSIMEAIEDVAVAGHKPAGVLEVREGSEAVVFDLKEPLRIAERLGLSDQAHRLDQGKHGL